MAKNGVPITEEEVDDFMARYGDTGTPPVDDFMSEYGESFSDKDIEEVFPVEQPITDDDISEVFPEDQPKDINYGAPLESEIDAEMDDFMFQEEQPVPVLPAQSAPQPIQASSTVQPTDQTNNIGYDPYSEKNIEMMNSGNIDNQFNSIRHQSEQEAYDEAMANKKENYTAEALMAGGYSILAGLKELPGLVIDFNKWRTKLNRVNMEQAAKGRAAFLDTEENQEQVGLVENARAWLDKQPVIEGPIQKYFRQDADVYKILADNKREAYSNGKSIIDTFSEDGATKGAEQLVYAVAENAPQMIFQIIFTMLNPLAGAGFMGANVAGNQYGEVRNDKTMTESEKFTNVLGNSAFEFIGEYMFTAPLIMKALGKSSKSKIATGFSNAIKKLIKSDTTKKILSPMGRIGLASLQDGSGELVTQLGQNLTNALTGKGGYTLKGKKQKEIVKYLSQGGGDAFLVGNVFGLGFGGAGALQNRTILDNDAEIVQSKPKRRSATERLKLRKLKNTLTLAQSKLDEIHAIYGQEQAEKLYGMVENKQISINKVAKLPPEKLNRLRARQEAVDKGQPFSLFNGRAKKNEAVPVEVEEQITPETPLPDELQEQFNEEGQPIDITEEVVQPIDTTEPDINDMSKEELENWYNNQEVAQEEAPDTEIDTVEPLVDAIDDIVETPITEDEIAQEFPAEGEGKETEKGKIEREDVIPGKTIQVKDMSDDALDYTIDGYNKIIDSDDGSGNKAMINKLIKERDSLVEEKNSRKIPQADNAINPEQKPDAIDKSIAEVIERSPNLKIERADVGDDKISQGLKKIGDELEAPVIFVKMGKENVGAFEYNGNVFINIDAEKSPLSLATHEFTHVFQTRHPKLWDKFSSKLEELYDGDNYKAWAAEKSKKITELLGRTPSKEGLMQELGAYLIEEQAGNESFWKNLHELDANLYEKILEIFKEIRKRMGKIFDGRKDSNMSKIFGKNLDQAIKAGEDFMNKSIAPVVEKKAEVKPVKGKTKGVANEFKVGDVLDPQGNTNMSGEVTIRSIKGNTIKFTDSTGKEFGGMSRSLVRDLIKGKSWKRVSKIEQKPTPKSKPTPVKKTKIEPTPAVKVEKKEVKKVVVEAETVKKEPAGKKTLSRQEWIDAHKSRFTVDKNKVPGGVRDNATGKTYPLAKGDVVNGKLARLKAKILGEVYDKHVAKIKVDSEVADKVKEKFDKRKQEKGIKEAAERSALSTTPTIETNIKGDVYAEVRKLKTVPSKKELSAIFTELSKKAPETKAIKGAKNSIVRVEFPNGKGFTIWNEKGVLEAFAKKIKNMGRKAADWKSQGDTVTESIAHLTKVENGARTLEPHAKKTLEQYASLVVSESVTDIEAKHYRKVWDRMPADELKKLFGSSDIDVVGKKLLKEVRFSIDTPQFKKWFGDSKVVDSKGEPLVVYHGTDKDFTIANDGVFWGAEDKDFAIKYAGLHDTKNGKVMELYFKISNPIDFKYRKIAKVVNISDYFSRLRNVIKEKNVSTDRFNEYKKNAIKEHSQNVIDYSQAFAWEYINLKSTSNFLKSIGYDGIEHLDKFDKRTFAVFSPNQIKSTQNKAPTDSPDIMLSIDDKNKVRTGGYGTIESSEKSAANDKREKVAQTDYSKVAEEMPVNKFGVIDETLKMVAPAARKGALVGKKILRKNIAELAHNDVVVADALEKMHKAFTWMDTKDSLDFIDNMETGKPQKTKELQKSADMFRDLLDGRRNTIQNLGKGQLENYIDNYFPHIWKDPKKAKNIISSIMGKKNIEGTKSFLKKRVIVSIKDGIERGLELVSDNPADMVLLKLHEMDRYIMAQNMIKDLKERGQIKFVYARSPFPEGYVKINDNAFTVYMPPEITKKDYYDKIMVNDLMSVAEHLGVDAKRFVNLGGKRLGYAKWYPGMEGGEEVRTKLASPESVAFHEIGHVLGYRYNLYDLLGRRNDGEIKTHKTGKNAGKTYLKATPEILDYRRKIDAQWRALADARYKGSEVTEGFKKYVRKGREKEAVMLEALIHAPDEFKRVAPDLKKVFVKFLNNNADLRPLLDIKPSLVLGENEAKIKVPGFTTLGNFYAVEPVGTILNNYLSPGLRSNNNKIIANTYNMLRGGGNVLNQANLALSLFHALNVTSDMMASTFGLGLRKLQVKGQRIKGLADMAVTPIAPIMRVWSGQRIRKAYKKQLDSIENPKLRQMVEAVIASGGRSKMDAFYYNQQIKALNKTLADISKGDAFTKMKSSMKLPFNLFGATMENLAKPLMEWYVPTGKIGLFSKLAQHEFERAENGQIDEDQLWERLTQSWDNVDNRMGQLVYDNLFWNKTLKDSLMLAVRSVGWNIGSWREFGGGIVDIGTTNERIKEGDVWLSQKMAYTIGAVVTYSVLGAIIQYALTGEPPEEAKDYLFPKTGNTNPDGSPERLSLPTYAKDWYAYAEQPLKTITHKMHPLWGLLGDLAKNKDYFNVEVRHTDDPLMKQAGQVVEHIAEAFLPFSIKNYAKMNKAAPGNKLKNLGVSITGISSAPGYLSKSPAQKLMTRLIVERIPDKVKTQEKFERSTYRRTVINRIRKGEKIDVKEAVKILGRRSYVMLRKEARKTPFASSFNRLSIRDALNVYTIATRKERKQVKVILRSKYRRARRQSKTEEV